MQGAIITPAVLLSAVAYGESDRVVTLYTRDHGKISALAKGARKSRARFGASLSLFVAGEAVLRDRRGAELALLERFDARADFSRLAADVVRLAHAAYATELLRELTVPRQVDPVLFSLILELYEAVANASPRSDTLRGFELRLLEAIGLRPVLDRCIGCEATDQRLDQDAVVDGVRGGLLCARCSARSSGGSVPIPAAARARLLAVRAAASLVVDLPPAGAEVDAAARQVMHALVQAHLRVPMRSLEFIRQLRATQ